MEILIGKKAGVCFGVENAINKTKEQLKKEKTIDCLGELVHNQQVIQDLKKMGVNFIEDIEEAKNKVIIRSHGAEKRIYETAKQNGIEIIDLTCPKVLYVHKSAEEYVNKNYYIVLVGQREHPEIIATKSFCGKEYSIIESLETIEEVITKIEKSKKEKVVILAQTTYSLEKFEKIVQEIKVKVMDKIVEVKNTICNATKERQEETKKLAEEVDAMIIIGGKNSSNTNKLYEVSKNYCANTQVIETSKDLEIEKIKNSNKIGIMAGASTPKESIEDVVEKLKQI